MTVQRNLQGLGIQSSAARAIAGTLIDGATATGTVQADAVLISNDTTIFSTVNSGTGCILPVGDENDSYMIVNDGANTLKVYPPSGGTINGGATNAAYSLHAGGNISVFYVTLNTIKVRESDEVLRAELAASGGSALVGFLQSGTGAVARTVQSKLRDTLCVKDFGAVGNGVADDTTAIQAGLTAAYATAKTLFFPTGTYLVNATLVNRGASMCGEGTFYSMIQAGPSFPGSDPIIKVEPLAAAYIEYLEMSHFSIMPTYNAVVRGGNAIYMNFPTATNLAQLNLFRVFIFTGNDYSLQINTNTTLNPQGVPSNSNVEQCVFSQGTKWEGVGDSVTLKNNIIRTTGARNGVYVYQTDPAGVASHFCVLDCNLVCAGGAVFVERARNFKFQRNNVELPTGNGTTNGAVVDIDGGGGTIPWTTISDNHIGIFGTAAPTSAIRIDDSDGCLIEQNTILSGNVVANGIELTSSAVNTRLGMNEISAQFTAPITDAGTGTRGIFKALTPVNGFTNAPGYQELQCYKSLDGIVTVQGALDCPVTPNGIVFAVLPVGFRPLAQERTCLAAVVGGAVSAQAMEIGANGNMRFYGDNTTTAIQFCVSFFIQNYVVGSV